VPKPLVVVLKPLVVVLETPCPSPLVPVIPPMSPVEVPERPPVPMRDSPVIIPPPVVAPERPPLEGLVPKPESVIPVPGIADEGGRALMPAEVLPGGIEVSPEPIAPP
jgi:hypothetical protein